MIQQTSASSYSAQQLRTTIVHETVTEAISYEEPKPMLSILSAAEKSIKLHYTLCRKEGAKFFMTNQRILVYNETQRILYYVNYDEKTQCPFRTIDNAPKPKKDYVYIHMCIFSRESQDNTTLVVCFNKGPSKDKLQCIEWKFIMDSKQIAKEWFQFVQAKKLQAMTTSILNLGSFLLQKDSNREQNSPSASPSKLKTKEKREDDNYSPDKSKEMKKELETINRPNNTTLSNSQEKQKQVKKEPQIKIPPITNGNSSRVADSSLQNLDWNLQFIHEPTSKTVGKFQKYCVEQFTARLSQQIFMNQIVDKYSVSSLRVGKKYLVMYYTLANSEADKRLREQFENYKYIIGCCKDKGSIGVPLACLIQRKGIVCLAKARFPESATILDRSQLQDKNPHSSTVNGLFKQLQVCTKIHCNVIKSSSVILNLSNKYGLRNGLPRIYIDEISSLLPRCPSQPPQSPSISLTQFSQGELVHPELILHNCKHAVDPRSPQTSKQLYYYIEESVGELVEKLSRGDTVLYGYDDVIDLLGRYGLNASALPLLCYWLHIKTEPSQLKSVKIVLMNVLICGLIMEKHIAPSIQSLTVSKQPHLIQPVVQSLVRKFVQRGTVLGQQAWKQLLLDLHAKYGGVAEVKVQHVQEGVILACLMSMIKGGVFDVAKLGGSPENGYTMAQGFLLSIGCHVSTYAIPSKQQDSIMPLCADPSVNRVSQLDRIHGINQLGAYEDILTPQNFMKWLAYLSYYVEPAHSGSQYPAIATKIYEHAYKQPLDRERYEITLNYVRHEGRRMCRAMVGSGGQEGHMLVGRLQQLVERAGRYCIYWLGGVHPYTSDVEWVLGEFYLANSNSNRGKGIQYLASSISACRKLNTTKRGSIGLANKLAQLSQAVLENECTGASMKECSSYLTESKFILQSLQSSSGGGREYGRVLGMLGRCQLGLGELDHSRASIDSCIGWCGAWMREWGAGQDKQQVTGVLYSSYCTLLRLNQLQGRKVQNRAVLYQIGKMGMEEADRAIFLQNVRICVDGVMRVVEASHGGPSLLGTFHSWVGSLEGGGNGSEEESVQRVRNICTKNNSNVAEYMYTGIVKLQSMGRYNNKQYPQQFGEFVKCVRSCVGNQYLGIS